MDEPYPQPWEVSTWSREKDREYVNEVLIGSYTSRGVERWWQRPRVQLDGKTPAEMWGEDSQRVVTLAETLLGPTAT